MTQFSLPRSTFSPMFSTLRMRKMVESMARTTGRLVKSLDDEAITGREFDLLEK